MVTFKLIIYLYVKFLISILQQILAALKKQEEDLNDASDLSYYFYW